jgi:hypothetical protein
MTALSRSTAQCGSSDHRKSDSAYSTKWVASSYVEETSMIGANRPLLLERVLTGHWIRLA